MRDSRTPPDSFLIRLRGDCRTFIIPTLATLLSLQCNAPSSVAPPSSLEFLGAQPSINADGGLNDSFWLWLSSSTQDASKFEIRCNEGDCPILSARRIEGSAQGVLAIVVDDSGSNTQLASVCVGCPTDPDFKRREAVAALTRELLLAAPQWKVALFDFGVGPNGPFKAARLLAGYTSYAADLNDAAQQLKSGSATWLYDSLVDVAPTVAGETRFNFPDGGREVARRVLLLSDGEDTSSSNSFSTAVDAGASNSINLDAIAYSRRDDAGTLALVPKAYRDIRRFTQFTGGIMGAGTATILTDRARAFVKAYTKGYVVLQIRMPQRGNSVTGTVRDTFGGQNVSIGLE